jgi:hypothetical protein
MPGPRHPPAPGHHPARGRRPGRAWQWPAPRRARSAGRAIETIKSVQIYLGNSRSASHTVRTRLRQSQFLPSAQEYDRGLVVLLSLTCALAPVLNSLPPDAPACVSLAHPARKPARPVIGTGPHQGSRQSIHRACPGRLGPVNASRSSPAIADAIVTHGAHDLAGSARRVCAASRAQPSFPRWPLTSLPIWRPGACTRQRPAIPRREPGTAASWQNPRTDGKQLADSSARHRSAAGPRRAEEIRPRRSAHVRLPVLRTRVGPWAKALPSRRRTRRCNASGIPRAGTART